MIVIKTKGSFDNTERFLKHATDYDIASILSKYGIEGAIALSQATPVDSGKTASSWNYQIEKHGDDWTLFWTNDNINEGVQIAIILQYGHGTRNGGWVQGRDYINPAIQPVMDRLAEEAWREVKRS